MDGPAMDAPASSSAPPPMSKHQAYWKARRRRRIQRLPKSIAVSGGMFLCMIGLAESGWFAEWPTARSAARALSEVEWARRWGVDLHFETVTEVDMIDASGQHGRTLGHKLVDTPYGPVCNHNFPEKTRCLNLTEITCATREAGSSTFPALDMEANSQAGATTFAIIITLFMFLGLAIVCDSFFEASLSAICEAMSLKDDVAGATWMAAGGSAPELATSVIGVFISRSDVGFGTIVGSAVFNVLFVIACCAFVAPNLKLTWWPLARDCSYYCFALAMIVIFVSDDLQITVWEAAILLLMYGGYVMIMYYNERLEEWVVSRIEACNKEAVGMQKMVKTMVESAPFNFFLYAAILTNAIMVILETMEFNSRSFDLPCKCDVYIGAALLERTAFGWINLAFNVFFVLEMLTKFYAYGFFGYWRIPLNCFDGSLVFLIVVEFILTESARGDPSGSPTQDANDAIGVGIARMLRLLKFVRFVRTLRMLRIGGMAMKPTVAPDPAAGGAELESKTRTELDGPEKAKEGVEGEEKTEEGGEEEDDDDDDGPFNPFEVWGDFSSIGGLFGRFFWFFGLPLSVTFWLTIPDCRREGREKWWLGTFGMCIFWIAALSGIMVWMVERLGVIYGVPESIMGIFVLAAGTSIPDCLSSVAVARRGHGDMAVSSSIGSNIFDVLIGLPIPWFIYTAILRPALGPDYGPQWVVIQSEALAVMILLLFVMVALVITTIHLSGWTLSVRLGGAMMGLYFVFLVFALLLDRKVIFPDCVIMDSHIGG